MEKTYNKIKFMGILFVLLFAFTGYAQLPTYQASLANDVLVSSTVYEFDIYLLRTGGTVFELSGDQIGLIFDNAVLNGGTPTVAFLPSTCTLSNSAQAPAVTINATSVVSGKRVLKIASKAPPGYGSGSIISNVAPGSRVGRVRITNSVPFMAQLANFAWTFLSTQYQTKISAYDQTSGLNVEITTQPTHLNNLNILFLPVELNTFTASSNGRDVNLNWQTKTETNSSMFQVEKTAQSTQNWVKVGEVAASGNSNSPKEYSFVDKKINSGKFSYRLKMIDNDGSFKYSNVVEAEVALPKDYAISQNYPNPFNPSTRIDYQLPFDSKVTLELYGITGEKIATIINGELTAGYYTADVNASALNLASGVYIYRMTAQNPNAQNFVQVKKLMLTK